jgi:beta-phosphoglucomutase family hydrolase
MSPTEPTGPLGLPVTIRALLFDLDGVITKTALVHAKAWKATFDAYLRERAERTGEEFREFDTGADYNEYVDGKQRQDGVRSFLASRGIELPEGGHDDRPGAETVHGIGNLKNESVQRLIREDGVEVYDGTVRYVKAAREQGLATAVVSSSANTSEVLSVTGLSDLFSAIVDGNTARARGLTGKPAPDTFLAGAEELGSTPEQAAVFEDATAGVAAGRAGGFGYVIGVDRVGHADDLLARGADIVVKDLDELLS